MKQKIMIFKKTICIILVQFILVQAFSDFMNINRTACAKTQKSETISVVDVNATVCEKIHENLMKGKPLTIKVKGDAKKTKTIITQTVNSVRKLNKQGIYFKYKASGKKGQYCYYTVSADNAKAYKYGVKFIKKLYKLTKGYMSTYPVNNVTLKYYQKYKTEKNMKLHIIYNHVYNNICCNYASAEIDGDISSINEDAGFSVSGIPDFYLNGLNGSFDCLPKLTEKQWYSLVIKEKIEGREDENDIIKLNSFEEFKEKIKKYPKALNAVGVEEGFVFKGKREGKLVESHWRNDMISLDDKIPMAKILASKCFGELNKANQVYLIANSAYFCSVNGISASLHNSKKGYGIEYSYDYIFNKKVKANADFKTPGQGMKKMYECKNLKGVCSVYATYEKLLFTQLGIKVWRCTDSNIGHAWTVLKVKNSVGKTLWVPFDYGIGPAEKLIINEKIRKKYLRTEKMRYKLYLSKVKGAPKKKNFSIADFI